MMQRFGISPELVEPMRPFLRALNWGTLPLLAYFALRRYLQAVNVATPIMFAVVSANIVNAGWRLGADLRPSRISRHGHHRLRMVHLLCPRLHGRRAGSHAAVGGVEASLLVDRRAVDIRIDLTPNLGLLRLGVAGRDADSSRDRRILAPPPPWSAKLGPVPLSGHEIALNCAALTFMVPLGISSAAAVRVGQAIGKKGSRGSAARRMVGDRARRRVHDLFRTGVRVDLPDIDRPAIFSGPAGDSYRRKTACWSPPRFSLFDGLQTVATGALRGAGDTKTPMLANFVAYWLIGIAGGLHLVLSSGMGRVWDLDRTVRRTDAYRVGALVGLAQENIGGSIARNGGATAISDSVSV